MKKSGFTLIELLVVIIILGILAAIAIPKYISVKEKAKASEAITQMGILAQEMQAYQQSHGGTITDWPATLNDVSSAYGTANWDPAGTPAAKFSYTGADYLLTAYSLGDTVNYINLNVANQYWNGTHAGAPKGIQE